jgi:zinc-dependent metalloproteinase lipoprotein
MNPLATSRKISCLLLFIVMLCSCHKQTFQSEIKTGDQLQVDSVAFSTGSSSLIGDGQSALDFIIQAYNKKTLTIEGKTFDSMVVIPADRIDGSSVKVVDESGAEFRDSYSTTSASPASKTFHAEVMGIASVPQTVSIQTPDTTYPKLQIKVIFHVFELSKLDSKHYPWYTYLDSSKLNALLNGLNGMFNRVGTHTPMGATANIEFVAANSTPAGKTLTTPGYDMFEYTSSFDWGWSTPNAAQLVKDNAEKLFWDPKKYLNIWVLPSAVFYGGITTPQPAYTLSSTPLDGLNMQQVASVDDVPLTEPESVGLMLGRDEFYSALRGPAPNLAWRFGTFYGLFHTYTYSWDPTVIDYCNDTRKFDINQYQKIYKTTPDNILFAADNVMDAPFLDYNIEGGQYIVSRLNCFTSGQVKRMRYVLQNCPERICWQ